MAAIVSLDAYRRRRTPPRPSTLELAGLAAVARETTAPTCKRCGRPVALSSRTRPEDATNLLAAMRAEGLCLLCYDPF